MPLLIAAQRNQPLGMLYDSLSNANFNYSRDVIRILKEELLQHTAIALITPSIHITETQVAYSTCISYNRGYIAALKLAVDIPDLSRGATPS